MNLIRRCTLFVLAALCLLTLRLAAAQTPAPPLPTPEVTPEATEAVFAPVEVLEPQILNTYPHDTSAYTQGLLLYNGFFYESAGEYGVSDLRKVDPTTGEVLQKVPVAPEFFAEGLALVDDHLIQITWKEEQALVYDLGTFEQTGNFAYTGEGWGLCYNGQELWMSDGSDTLVTRDPDTFEVTRQVQLTFQGHRLDEVVTSSGVSFQSLFSRVNELECVGDAIYANVYLTDYILRIDQTSGAITGIILAADLLTKDERAVLSSGEVLNGIAYDAEKETFFLTGKHWPKLFEVQFTVRDTVNLNG